MNQITLGKQATRDAIQKLEGAMLDQGDLTTDFDEYLTHYFGEGTYVREMRLPVDTVIVGKIHKYEEVCVLTKGIILVRADGASESNVYEAPYVFNAAPGKKVLYILEDAIFLNILPNPNNLRDIDALERELILPEYPALEVVS